jgi:hypothetical protein
MKAIILNHPNDIKLFSKFDKKIKFYAYNYYTYSTLKKKNKKIYYINDSIYLKKFDNFSLNTSLNWYKKNRKKNLNRKKISIGNIVLPRLMDEFSNSIKNYLIIKNILKKNSKIFFPKNEENYITNFIDLFPNKIKFYKSQNKIQKVFSNNFLSSKIVPLPKIHKLSNLARIIQSFLFSKKINKIIYYPDPRTKNFFKKFKNILSLNLLTIYKSFYFKLTNRYIKIANKVIDFDYKKDLNQFIKSKQTKDNEELFFIFKKCIDKIVNKNKQFFLRTIAVYFELFEYYKPKSIIFPGILNYDYASAIELANIKNIKTFIAIDGVLTNFDKTEFNKNYFYNKIIAWGNENKILLEKHGIKKKDIILSSPYLTKIDKNYISFKKSIIVLPLGHYSQKVSSLSDKCIYHTLDILKILNKIGEKNIILKFKNGNYDIDKLINIYSDQIIEYNIKNIVIKKGPMENFFENTKLLIGRCSTTIYEAVNNNIDYHIYEPYDLGLSNSEINNSNLFNRKSISRNGKELFKNLKKKNKSSIIKSKKKIFRGKELSPKFFND